MFRCLFYMDFWQFKATLTRVLRSGRAVRIETFEQLINFGVTARFNFMTKIRSIFLISVLTFMADCFGQDSLTSDRFIVKRGQKRFDLNKLTILEIDQIIVSHGRDSISFSIIPDSIYKVNDTLFVKPFMVEENKFLDFGNPYSNRK